MIQEKIKNVMFSFNGISLIIGIVGGVFGMISPFITNWNLSVNLKWFVGIILFSISIFFILLKVIVDILNDHKNKNSLYTKVISYIPQTKTFLTEMNEMLGHGAMVSIVYVDNNYEVEFGKAYVNNIQENFLQIKLIELDNNFEENYINIIDDINNNNISVLNKLIIKSFVRYE